MEVGRVGVLRFRERPGDYYASRWSAAGGMDRLPQKPS